MSKRYATLYETPFAWCFYVRDDAILEPRAQELRKSTLKRNIVAYSTEDLQQKLNDLRAEYDYKFDYLGLEIFYQDCPKPDFYKKYDDCLWVTLKLRTNR